MPSIVCTVPSASLPVDQDEAFTYMRVDGPDLKAEAEVLLRRATTYCQDYQWAHYISATFVERYDSFPCEFRLSKNPVSSVTSVQYVDTAGVTQTLVADTDYTVDIYSKPCRIVPAYNKTWPSTYGHINDVVVTYVAGYGSAPKDVPENVRMAVIMFASELRRNHEAQDEAARMAVHRMLDLNTFRVIY